MALRAVEHIFNGNTTPIASYDSTKTNLGTLMVQKSGTSPEDNFVGPLPVAVARPMEESTGVAMMYPHSITFSSTIDWVFMIENSVTAAKRIFLYEYNKSLATYSWKGFINATLPSATNVCRGFRAQRYLHTTGTVAVAAPSSVYSTGTVTVTVAGLVTHSGTGFLATYVGKMIGFGSTNVAEINCWYPIISYATTSTMNILGASCAYLSGSSFVIADCTLTGSSTLFTTDLIAAGTGATAVTGGLGPRIGFGSTDPEDITQWYHIGQIASNTSLGLTTSPGVIPAGTSYVIEEIRFAIAMTNTTAGNGGLFVLKGAGYHDFTTAGSVFPSIATAVNNQRGVYWLNDNGAGAVSNTTANGIAVEATETNKQTHYAYVLNGTNTSVAKFYKYNLLANDTVASGKMQLAGGNIVATGDFTVLGLIPNQPANNLTLATLSHGPGSGNPYLYFTTTHAIVGTVTVNGTAVTGSSTVFTSAMIGYAIGFGSTSPSMITAWYIISARSSNTAITLATTAGTWAAGTAYVVDYGRLYCAAVSGITGGSTTFITAGDARQEIPTGGVGANIATAATIAANIGAFTATGGMMNVQYISNIDRLLITTYTSGISNRQYITRYPSTDLTPFDHIFGLNDRQQDQSIAFTSPIHFNTGAQLLSSDANNGIVHISRNGATALLNQLYALPLGAHWTYASTSSQRVITPSITTTGCVKFDQVLVADVHSLGDGELKIPTETFRVYYRTANIGSDATSSWVLLGDDGDLSAVTAASAIQFMLEFFTIGEICMPARIMRVTVTYEDGSTDSHYQISTTLSSISTEKFAWRFCQAFGGTVPTLKVELFNADTGSSLMTDTTVAAANGTWEKSTDGGSNWTAYNTTDKANETTYIRYTPTSLTNDIIVRALLTQN